MDELVFKIKVFAPSHSRSTIPPPPPVRSIEEAETRLGFLIPPLLKSCYLTIGNGGFGPGYGVIGLNGGYASDFGTLVETYEQLKRDQESEGKQWKAGLLPFCEWGCNIFSCVDCADLHHPVYTFEECEVWLQQYTLHDFFQMWIEGVDILSLGQTTETVEIINPFTGNKTRVYKRRPRNK